MLVDLLSPAQAPDGAVPEGARRIIRTDRLALLPHYLLIILLLRAYPSVCVKGWVFKPGEERASIPRQARLLPSPGETGGFTPRTGERGGGIGRV